MKERIQTRGHCQGCGRLQAAGPKLAHHGYTVEWGYFHGTCYGAKELPLEVSRELLDKNVAGALREADNLEDKALKLEQRELDPVHGKVRDGSDRRGYKLVPYDELSEPMKAKARIELVASCRAEARHLRSWAPMMQKLADEVHGKPLVEVKVGDQSKVINVGDRVKVCGGVVVVSKIQYATARGVGPYVNGTYIEHVYWLGEDGAEHRYPKRYARKVQA